MNKPAPTYTKMLEDESYEFGTIEMAANRKRDRLVPHGIRPDYYAAERARAELADRR